MSPSQEQRRKHCPECGIKKPTSAFARNRSARDGLQSYCKPCFLNRYVRVPCPECGKPKAKQSVTCAACASRVGEGNGQWKGGRIVRPDGYVNVWTPTGYVREHRLAMEQVLGRPLFPDENVHHINGVKDDNRPENLELWVTSQPKGQRPEDLVAWAREILERYAPAAEPTETTAAI